MTPPWTRRDTLLAVLSAIGCNLVGLAGTPFTTPNDAWFRALELPAFYPPNWLFGVVWPILYAMLGVAAYLVYREGLTRTPSDGSLAESFAKRSGQWILVDREVRVALALFALQLIVNVSWSPVFWGLRRVDLGVVVLVVLLVLTLATIVAFARVDRRAAALLVPYVLWVGFATLLNAAILVAN